MQTKLTKDQKRTKIKRIELQISKLSVDPVILDWKKWQKADSEVKRKVYRAWEQYFNLVKMSKSKSRFFELKKAFEKGEIYKMRDLKAEAEEALNSQEYIKKPAFRDPYEFQFGPKVSDYQLLQQRLEELRNEGVAGSESILG